MTQLERTFAPRIFNAIDRAVNASARNVARDGRAANLVEPMLQLEELVDRLLLMQYRRTVQIFGDRVGIGLKSAIPHYIETKATFELFAEETRAWISSQAAEKSEIITETTRSMIQSVMVTGFDEQMLTSAIAELIRQKAGGVIAKSRAIMIARTETHNAASFGSLQAAKASEVVKKKSWVAAADERTRTTHIEADAQYVDGIGMEDFFSIGADRMLHPGGGSDPGENIQCRCVLVYLTE